MSEREKLTASHLRRTAFIYPRQSTQAQLERNVESTELVLAGRSHDSVGDSPTGRWTTITRVISPIREFRCSRLYQGRNSS